MNTETEKVAAVAAEPNAEVKGTEMNVYTALSKRKILQKQLEELQANPVVVSMAVRKSATQINGKSREDVINDMKAAYDRPRALIKNIQAINSAIAISNATTKVEVAGRTYTVEELIFRMLHINDEVKFYNAIVKNLNDSRVAIEKNNRQYLDEATIADHVAKLLPTMVAPDAPQEERDKQAAQIREIYIKNQEMEMLDPYDLLNKAQDILAELSEFREEVNNALNLSNIQTIIRVNLEG